jgi:hypothetical protein
MVLLCFGFLLFIWRCFQYLRLQVCGVELYNDVWMMDREGFRRKESWASRCIVVAFARGDWENYDKQFGWSLSRTRFKPVTFRAPIWSSASCELVLNVLKRIRFEILTLTNNVGLETWAFWALPISAIVPSQAWVYSCLMAWIAGSNPAGAWVFVTCVCCVLCR